MDPTQDQAPLEQLPSPRALAEEAPTVSVAAISTTSAPASPSTGSSREPGVVIVGPGDDIHKLGASGLPLTEEKTVISKRPGGMETPTPAKTTPSRTIGESLLGCQLDHYELVEFVGGGGMGSVFRARDTRLGREVAVKVLARDETDDETVRRFQNEAQSAARLDHPNIARVHYVGEASGWNYIVFEFIEGINLRDLVQRDGPLPLEDALRYTYAVSEALLHAWEREVVHRDVKPSNLLVTTAGALKLVDMGLARMHQVDSSSDDLTASGVTLGTFDYISPEQARDPRMADVRSDIYSLGCTLFYLLTGQPPFPEGTALQKLLSHSQEDPPDLRSFRPELSPKINAFIHRMLAKRPGQRHQSPADVMQEIVQLSEQLGLRLGVSSAVQLATAEPSLASRVLPVMVPALVLLAAIVLVDRLWPTAESATISQLPPLRLQPASAVTAATPVEDPPRAPLPAAGKGTTYPKEPVETTPAEKGFTPSSGDTTPTVPSETKPPETPRPDPPATARPALSKIIVRPPTEDTASSTEPGVANSLANAVQLAAKHKVSEIQIEWTGELIESPLEINSPEQLIIRAAKGFAPVIVFRPELGAPLDGQRMIRVGGGTMLHLHELEIRLELPTSGASLPWALFSLGQVMVVSLESCTLTVANAGAAGTPAHEVAVFEFQPPKMTETMMDPGKGVMPAHTTLELKKSIVRGAADLLKFIEERPCKFAWTDGLLVTTERALVTTGIAEKPQWFGQIELELEQVTLIAHKGLYQLRRRDDAAHQLGVEWKCKKCVLVTDPQAPWFEFVGGPTVEQVALEMQGAGNRYVRPDLVFLRIKSKGEPVADFNLDNAVKRFWLKDANSLSAVTRWETPVDAQVPPHEHRKEDYLIRGPINVDINEGTPKVGFLPQNMPSLPARPTAEDSPE